MTKEQNTFEQLDEQQTTLNNVENETLGTPEMSVDSFSDKALCDQVKYVRPDLHGQKDVVAKLQVFTPNFKEAPQPSQSGTSHYWKVQVQLTYESENESGIPNREYISGAKIFRSDDGTPGNNINFWYKGAQTQAAYLWELVAKAKNIEPDQLSPREFVAFLNSKPKVDIVGKKYKNYKAAAGAPEEISKNMPGNFN